MTPLYIKCVGTQNKIFGKIWYLSYMKKIIKLTESDLTRIVKRVISENMESEMIDNVKNEIIQSISKEDLMFLGKMYSELGAEQFKDITKDVIEDEKVERELSEISFSSELILVN